VNRGKYRHLVEIWQDIEGSETDELGNKILVPTKVGETLASTKSLVGSLIAGRPAGTKFEKTTCKFCWPYFNFPVVIAGVHYLMFRGKRFNIDYSLNDEFKDEELQVFCSEIN